MRQWQVPPLECENLTTILRDNFEMVPHRIWWVAYGLSVRPKSVTLSDLERRNGPYFALLRRPNSLRFKAMCVKLIEAMPIYSLRQECSPKHTSVGNMWFMVIFSKVTETAKIRTVQYCAAISAITEFLYTLFLWCKLQCGENCQYVETPTDWGPTCLLPRGWLWAPLGRRGWVVLVQSADCALVYKDPRDWECSCVTYISVINA